MRVLETNSSYCAHCAIGASADLTTLSSPIRLFLRIPSFWSCFIALDSWQFFLLINKFVERRISCKLVLQTCNKTSNAMQFDVYCKLYRHLYFRLTAQLQSTNWITDLALCTTYKVRNELRYQRIG